jgi:hypothetical protein
LAASAQLREQLKVALAALARRALPGTRGSAPDPFADAAGALAAGAKEDSLPTDLDRLAALARFAPLETLGLTTEQKNALIMLGRSVPAPQTVAGSPFLVPNHPDDVTRGFFRPSRSRRWPNNVVPYDTMAAGSALEGKIQQAIEHIQDKTTVKFVKRSNEAAYVRFVATNRNDSLVGRQGDAQPINLQSNPPAPVGVVIHEVCHALGLYHEQNRPDRDDFIKIHLGAVMPSNVPGDPNYNTRQFDKITTDAETYGLYDLSSVMHYDGRAFAAAGQFTMTAKDGTPLPDDVGRLDDNKRLSRRDIGALEEIYGAKP